MIGIEVKIPNTLKKKLSKTNVDNVSNDFVRIVGINTLVNVREFGIGSGLNIGGSPHWQGPVTVLGHYSGYLSDTHTVKQLDNYNAQIVSSSGFAEGVIIGQSTNWTTRDGGAYVFTPNPYHKRAVDKLIKQGKIQTIWKNVLKRHMK